MPKVTWSLMLCLACAAGPAEVQQRKLTEALSQHRFAVSFDAAKAKLLSQSTWPGQPFGTLTVKLEENVEAPGHVVLPVTITSDVLPGRPRTLATIELFEEPNGVRVACRFEQPDARCADWVLATLGEEEPVRAAAAAPRPAARPTVAASGPKLPQDAKPFTAAWEPTFLVGVALGGNFDGAQAGLVVRGGALRAHARHLTTAYLLEYQFFGQSTSPGGGFAHLVVPTFHLEVPFLNDAYARPPAAYALAGFVGRLDNDATPGFGYGYRAGLGFRADRYFVEGYVQQVWPTSDTRTLAGLAMLGIGF